MAVVYNEPKVLNHNVVCHVQRDSIWIFPKTRHIASLDLTNSLENLGRIIDVISPDVHKYRHNLGILQYLCYGRAQTFSTCVGHWSITLLHKNLQEILKAASAVSQLKEQAPFIWFLLTEYLQVPI